MVSRRQWLSAVVLSVSLAVLYRPAAVAAAAWTPPKDNALTDKQVTNYLHVLKAALDDFRAAGNAAENAQSSSAAVAAYLNGNAKFKADLAAHGMSEEEYHWVGDRVMDAWGATVTDQAVGAATKGMAEQRKTTQQRIDELNAKLATYQKAQAQGRRLMTKDERQAAIESAKSEQQSLTDDMKQHEEEIKQFTDDAAKADADAKAADALAKNPPADISADDRPGYVEGKKADAQTARDAAKEARDKVEEARKAREESLAKAAAAKAKIADPDLPATDEEKAEVKKANEETIASLKTEIADAGLGMKRMDEAMAEFTKNMADQRTKNPVPPQNVELFRKHQAEFENAWGMKPAAQ